jgi:hypothetical protein
MHATGLTRTAALVIVGVALLAGTIVGLLLPGPDREARPNPGDPATMARTDAGRSVAPPTPEPPTIVPRPFSETEAVEGAASSRGTLEIEVIAPGGSPAANARVVLAREEKLLAARTTNAEGIAAMPAGQGEADVTVIPEGAATHRTKIAIDPGRRRIELPPGVSITGRVEVGGEPPRDPVKLRAACRDLPPVIEAAWDAIDEDLHPALKISAAGDFELRGLAAGSEWTILPRSVGYRLDEVRVGDRVDPTIVAPASGVVIRLTRLPVIRGRVVVAETRAPVPKALCMLAASWSTGTVSQTALAGEDGRFALAVGSPHDRGLSIVRVDLTVMGPNRVGTKKVTLEPAPKDDVDLGDVAVPSSRKINYVVRDPAGAPIEGALARIDYRVDGSSRTDAQGRGVLTIAAGVSKVFVGAFRYSIAEVPIPQEPPDPLPVVLSHAAGLLVHVTSSQGGVHPSIRVRISADVEQPFQGPGEQTGNDPLATEVGASSNESGSWGPEGSQFTFSPAADGRYVVTGLKTGVRLTVDAVDAIHHVLASAAVTLAPGEWKSVDLEVKKSPRLLRGRVRDAAGKPIVGAMAMIDHDPASVAARMTWSIDSHQLTTATDQAGRFVLSGIFDDVVHFGVDKEGYAPIVQRSLLLPAEGVELDLRMQAGCRLTVKVVQPGGAPVPDLDLMAEVPGYSPWRAHQLEPGTYALADLPPDAEATIKFEFAGHETKRVATVNDGHVETITLPGAGKLIVDFADVGDGPFVLTLRVPGEEEDRFAHPIATPAPGSARVAEVASVVAGEFLASLRVPMAGTPDAAVPQTVKVGAGETLRLVFRRP